MLGIIVPLNILADAVGILVGVLQLHLGTGAVGQVNAGDPVAQLLVGVLNVQVLGLGLAGQLEAQNVAVGIQVQVVVLTQLGVLIGVAVQIVDDVVCTGVGVLGAVVQLQIGVVAVAVVLHAADLTGRDLGSDDLGNVEVVVLVLVDGEDDVVVLLIALDIEVAVVQFGVVLAQIG